MTTPVSRRTFLWRAVCCLFRSHSRQHVAGLAALLFFLPALPGAQAADGFSVLRLSTPLIFSGSLGLRLGDDPESLRPTLQAEAGVGGGRVAIGFDHTGASTLGFGIKAALLRTWLEPIEVDKDQTFLGLEAEASIKRLIFNVGGYGRLGDGNDDWLVSTGLGFIF